MNEFNQVDLNNPTKDIAIFSQTDAALADLANRYGFVPDISTKEGYDQIKEAVSTLTKYRTTLEKERKRWKAPFLDAGRMIDSEAKRITAALLELETPMKNAKDEYDNAERMAKEKRIAEIETRITEISNHVNMARGKSSDAIKYLIKSVEAIDALEGFYELTEKAIQTRINTLAELNELLGDAVNREEFAKEQAEFAKQKAELEAMKAQMSEKTDTEQEQQGIEESQYIQPAPLSSPRAQMVAAPTTSPAATLASDSQSVIDVRDEKLKSWARKHGINQRAMNELYDILNG